MAPDHGPSRHGSVPGDTTSTCPLSAIRPGRVPGSVDGQAPQLVARRLFPGVVRVRAQRGEVVLVQVGVEPERRAPARPARSSAARSSPVTLGTCTNAAASRTSASSRRRVPIWGGEPSTSVRAWTIGEGTRRCPDQMISPMDAPLVEVQGLELRFGRRAALSGVDLAVGPGQVHGLLGPTRRGQERAAARPRGRAGVRADRSRSPRRGLRPRRQTAAGADRGAARAATRCRIALARAVAGEPAVLLVDEPSGGFDAETARRGARARDPPRRRAAAPCVWATRRLDVAPRSRRPAVTLLAGGRVRYTGSVEALDDARAGRVRRGAADQSLDRAA